MKKLREYWKRRNNDSGRIKIEQPTYNKTIHPNPGQPGSPMQNVTALGLIYSRLHNQCVSVKVNDGEFRDLIIDHVKIKDNLFFVNGIFVSHDDTGHIVRTLTTEWISQDDIYMNLYW